MSSNLSAMFDYWKNFSLSELQKELDNDAADIGIRQDESEASRKKLVELSREFRKTTPDELRKMVAPLLKSFQAEIDALSKRSKCSETAFLNIYKKIIELPDPTPALEFATQLQKKTQKLQELEIFNKQLKDRLEEYKNEFAEVKNQEVTVKQLKEKLKELEEKIEMTVQSRTNEKEREIQKSFAEREQQLLERQTELAKKLGEAELKANSLQTALNAAQSELFDTKAKHDETMNAKSDEVELLAADLERANERAISAEKNLEQLQQEIKDLRSPHATGGRMSSDGGRAENMEQAIDILKRSSLEVELMAKEKEVSQLVEDVQRLQQIVNKLRDSNSSQMSRLEEELTNRSKTCTQLEQRLNAQSDYDEVKRELNVLKSLEFSCLSPSNDIQSDPSSESKSLETLLLEKNRLLQSENTTLKCSNSDLKGRLQNLQEQNNEAMSTLQEQKLLIVQLEEDLRSVNALSVMFRGDAEGECVTPTNQSAEIMASLVSETSRTSGFLHPETVKSATDGLLPIIQNQRERFRLRAQEMESVNIAQQQQIQLLQNEMDKLRSDNLKLYEKIKFLQGYSKGKSSMATDDMDSRYSSQYDQRLDPFNSFNQKERHKRYMDLKPYDKITLGMGRFIMTNKKARMVFFFYTLFLHIFIFLVLYKLAYTASCQRDTAAEDWHKKFADHMAEHHPEQGP